MDKVNLQESKCRDQDPYKDQQGTTSKFDSKHDSKYDNTCFNSLSLDGCSNCTYFLSDTEFTSVLDAVSMVSIFELLTKETHLFPASRILLGQSIITCSGDITIVYTNVSDTNSVRYNRTMCFRTINEWLRNNISKIYDTLNILYMIICASILYYDDNEQRACQVLDNLEIINNFIQRYLKDATK